MAASLTGFGIVVVPLVIGISLFRRPWLLPALVIASTMQAFSILNLDFGEGNLRHGVTAFSLLAVVIVLSLIGRVRRLATGRDWLCGSAGWNLKLWLAYAAIAVSGAGLLPHIFSSVPVYLLIGKASFEAGVTPLQWSLSNIAEAANLILLIGVLVYIRLHSGDRLLVKRMIAGLIIALVLSALIGFLQRIVWHQDLNTIGNLFASNSPYVQRLISYAGPVARVEWPFIEPFYGSAWYAAMFGGGLAVFFVGKRTHLALLGMLVAGFALLNSLGATGIVAIGVSCLLGVLLSVFVFVKQPQLRWALGYQFALAGLVAVCCILAVYIVLRHNGVLPSAQVAVVNLLAGNNPTLWGDIQPQTNLHALTLLRDSFGLGVGLGSNRASSYFASLFSNTGVLGGVMFLAALFNLVFALVKTQTLSKTNDTALFLLGALITATISVAIAIPDQNWPGYWVFILTSYAWISQALPAVPPFFPKRSTIAESEI